MPTRHVYVQTAIDALNEYILRGKRLQTPPTDDEQLNRKHGCFVSLHQKDGSLRGCIGTIEPRFNTLFEEIVQNSIAAASADPRFAPVEKKELKNLHISVDVLTTPESTTPDKLDPSKYGLIISDGFRKGVLLPALEGVNTAQEQIDIVKRKANLNIKDNSSLYFYRFESKRYE